MNLPAPPLERYFDLNRLSDAGQEILLAPGPDECRSLAAWVGVESIERLDAIIALTRLSTDRFRYEGRFEADLTQSCVVTLEPVKSHLEGRFTRELHLLNRGRHTPPAESVELAPGAGDDESPEDIESSRYDVARPLLEEFSLAIDPYPRSPEAAFAAPEEGEAVEESPFAVLKGLKSRS